MAGVRTERLASGVSTDEHEVAVLVSVDQAEVAAQFDEHVGEAAPLDEVSPQGGPLGVLAQRNPLASVVRDR